VIGEKEAGSAEEQPARDNRSNGIDGGFYRFEFSAFFVYSVAMSKKTFFLFSIISFILSCNF